ncbi:hypothetical protein DSL72_005493 [Monilinia vaccinii-corymbosi]|uniref:Restriction of telomere capping protein 4 n=1 Tax=Monilinia vaccinii-corymbosi TaxID=61207 RepID=A0A8A3PFT1_9HELO|nr:hypothetical protein DSL72_005493 [Monilinia vaccinii-corymbosi]
MQPTKLDLDDSRKAQRRRAGLSRGYGHNLLKSINRPKKEEQPEIPIETGTKSRASNANISHISGGVGDTKSTRPEKREVKESDKENQSAMPCTLSVEDEDVHRLPDDSDDGAQFVGDSSDDESPSRVGADMTKTLFGPKSNESNQTSISPVPCRKSTRNKTADSGSSISLKRKKDGSDSRHDPEVDRFGNIQSGKKKFKSYIQTHKEPKPPRPGANSVKKSYGKKKVATYGKKSPPAQGFKNYVRDSSPSLISDDGKEKLQDYTSDTPTQIQSPIKGGFVRPDFSDDDLSDLYLPSSLKQLNSEPPSTQFQQLQRYDDDDDDLMDEAEGLVKKLNPDVIIDINDFEREDSSDLNDYTGPRCPMCNEHVAAEDLEAFGEMNTRRQEKFCLSHQRKSARSDWKSKGYPDIDWTTLDSRISNHHAFIKKIIGGASCHSRSILDETIKAGKDRNLMKSTTNLIPGYYGSRGLRLISENIMSKFTPKLKERAPIDRLIAARGPTAFVESVVIPEVTVLLIQEDMKVDEEGAREILKESCEMGDLVNEEIKDVVKLKPKKKKHIDDSEVEEHDCDF